MHVKKMRKEGSGGGKGGKGGGEGGGEGRMGAADILPIGLPLPLHHDDGIMTD